MMTNWILKKLFGVILKKMYLSERDVVVVMGDDINKLTNACKMLGQQILPIGVAAIGLTNDITVEKLSNIPDEIKDMIREVI